MSIRAAIGLRAHSGWAAAVAVAHPKIVILRRRIELLDGNAPAQPYHAAVEAETADARRIVDDCAARAARMGAIGLRALVEEVEALGHRVAGCGLLLASGLPLPDLRGILASHALIHTAEGELYRDALRAAALECGLRLVEIREREIAPDKEMDAIGKSIGPPWRQDQKLAAAAAMRVLAR